MKKRLISLLLTVIMLLGVVSPAAMAAGFEIETIVKPKYQAAGSFSDGLAAVKQNGKWGYIDEDGNMVIKPQFDFANPFSEGVAVVGYYDMQSSSPDYDEYTVLLSLLHDDGTVIDLYTEEYGEVYRQMYYDGAWNPIESAASEWFCQNGVVRVNYTPYTTDGQQIKLKTDLYAYADDDYPFDYFIQVGPCHNGVIPMRASWMGYGDGPVQNFYMDKEGNLVRTFPVYDSGAEIGLYTVYAPDQERIIAWYCGYDEDWNWIAHCGAMDLNGNWVIKPQYANFRYMLSGKFFCDGLWSVQNDEGKWGAVDKDGNVVIPFEYDGMGSFTEGMCMAIKDGKAVYIDKTNKAYEVSSVEGSAAEINIGSHFGNGVAAVYNADDGQAYCIQNVVKNGMLASVPGTEQLGNEVYFPDYDPTTGEFGYISGMSDIIAIKEGSKWGFAKMTFHLDLPDESAMDSWAYDEVVKAIEAGLVPNELQNQYKSNITRADFALLFMEVATEITGKSVEELVKDNTGKDLDELMKNCPFVDTNARYIVAANALGIINGRGNGIFDPYATITRQDAATLVLRAAVAIKADAMDVWGDKIAAANIAFNDGNDFAEYAREGIKVMAALDVMKGVGNNTFAPKATYTRQQSFMTAYRLLNQLVEAD